MLRLFSKRKYSNSLDKDRNLFVPVLTNLKYEKLYYS